MSDHEAEQAERRAFWDGEFIASGATGFRYTREERALQADTALAERDKRFPPSTPGEQEKDGQVLCPCLVCGKQPKLRTDICGVYYFCPHDETEFEDFGTMYTPYYKTEPEANAAWNSMCNKEK